MKPPRDAVPQPRASQHQGAFSQIHIPASSSHCTHITDLQEGPALLSLCVPDKGRCKQLKEAERFVEDGPEILGLPDYFLYPRNICRLLSLFSHPTYSLPDCPCSSSVFLINHSFLASWPQSYLMLRGSQEEVEKRWGLATFPPSSSQACQGMISPHPSHFHW